MIDGKVWIINKSFLAVLAVIVVVLGFLVSFHHSKVVVYHNCSQLKEAGHSDIHKGSPYYEPQLDADHDGISCER